MRMNTLFVFMPNPILLKRINAIVEIRTNIIVEGITNI